jgi:hypothetical protein
MRSAKGQAGADEPLDGNQALRDWVDRQEKDLKRDSAPERGTFGRDEARRGRSIQASPYAEQSHRPDSTPSAKNPESVEDPIRRRAGVPTASSAQEPILALVSPMLWGEPRKCGARGRSAR